MNSSFDERLAYIVEYDRWGEYVCIARCPVDEVLHAIGSCVSGQYLKFLSVVRSIAILSF